MKILQVIPALAAGFGGPTNAVLQLSAALAHRGNEVAIFTTDADIEGRLKVPLGIPVDINRVKAYYFPLQTPKHYKFSLPLAAALKEHIPGFDIVHIHSLFQFSTLAACYYCRKYRKPYIIRPLGQLDPQLLKKNLLFKKLYLELFERANLEKAYAVHVTCELEKLWCESFSRKIKNIIIPLGVDTDEFRELPSEGIFRLKYPQLKGKKIILFLGRINFKKGLDILLKAFVRLVKERSDIFLVIAGPDREGYGLNLRRIARSGKIEDKIIFTGMLQGEDKKAALAESDIFVLPSYSENFGMAVIEAMSCGLPVVISNKVGIYREVKENNAGIIVECNDESLYSGIKYVLENREIARRLSVCAREFVQKYYNIERIVDMMLELYKDALCCL